MVINMFEDDDFIDEYFEYDMVMNDGKEFFGDKKKQPPKGGCLTATISMLCLMVGIVLLVISIF